MTNLKTSIRFLIPGFIVLTLITIALYSSVNDHVFLYWDDKDYIVENNMIRPLSLNNVIAMFTEFDSANWHPMTWLSYAINFAIWGELPAAFKWTNIGIHILNSFLVFILSVIFLIKLDNPQSGQRQLRDTFFETRYTTPGLIAAFLFAISPQHVESVAWISDRKDILCCFFYLGALVCYIYSRGSTHQKSWNHLVLLLFLFALMSKSVAVTLPLVIVFLDIYILKTVYLKGSFLHAILEVLRNKTGMIILSALVSIITIITQSSQIKSVEEFSILSRLVNASINYFYYIGSIIFPRHLSPYHPIPEIVKQPNMISILPVLGMILLFIFLAWRHKYIDKLVIASFVIYSVMSIPSIGLIQLAYAARADRYAYLPTLIFYILIGTYIYRYFVKVKNNKLAVACAVIIMLGFGIYLSTSTYTYATDWKNDELLWHRVISLYPESGAPGYINLGNVSYNRKEYDEAIAYYKKAVEINPSMIVAYKNLGNAYLQTKNLELVHHYYKEAIENNPENPHAYELLGDYYYKNKKLAAADKIYKRMLYLDPKDPASLIRNSVMDFIKGEFEPALQKVDFYLMLRPHNKKAKELRKKILAKSSWDLNINEISTIEYPPESKH